MKSILLSVLMCCPVAAGGVCQVRSAVRVQRVFVQQPQQVLFLVAPPNYYGAPQYAQQPAQIVQQQQPATQRLTAGSTYDAEASDLKIAAAIDRQSKSIDAALTRLVARLEKIEKSVGIVPEPVPDSISESIPDPVTEQPPPEPTPAAPEDVVRIIEQKCGFCHADAAPKGGFALSQLNDPDKISQAIELVESDHMPRDPNGDPAPLGEQDKALVLSALRQLEEMYK